MTESKIIIVSNRLPIKLDIKNDKFKFKQSEGGLATGLGSYYKEKGGTWIGWPGAIPKDQDMQQSIETELRTKGLEPVFLTAKQIHDFYEGFSNETLWPLFHYFPSYANYNEQHWKTYVEVNQKFADVVIEQATPNDTIWIHDYQLMLVPQMVRKAFPDISIGFFQHIPFPSYEVFRLIPWRAELLAGLLGADLIGFHTNDDVRHFISAILRVMDVQSNMNVIRYGVKVIHADAFPIGIDYDKFHDQVSAQVTRRYSEKILEGLDGKKLMISIDRLDYSKGIVQRLEAFTMFLKRYPEFRSKLIFYQLIVPSRDKVWQYDQLKQEIDKMVSNINAEYGTLTWQPIQYFYRSWSLDMLSALYYTADIAIVTPMRDGMNLVCKEYIASKTDRSGVLILSEMAGASKELTEASTINPNDVVGVADAIFHGITMEESEKTHRIQAMQQTIKKFNIHLWVKNFLMRLKEIKKEQDNLKTSSISDHVAAEFKDQYAQASKRLIFLDYDGTLVPFTKDPLKAVPSQELLQLLKRLASDNKNKLVIISGRKKDTLNEWLGDLPLDIIAEHGSWTKEKNGKWEVSEDLTGDWKQDFKSMLEGYELRTPGSFVEEKDFSLAWHYRKVETALGELRAKEIATNFKYQIADRGLQLLEGHKVIEIKSILINKGVAVEKWLKKNPAAFNLAIGDDMTDEDTFKAMPAGSITIKVGIGPSEAQYFIESPEKVSELLDNLSK